ncbi:hypothetical protein [Desulfosporosinus youngiae]|uniref:Uncharacterized protein n=1 Tax=Desulfosporosinus youngiae DSM 17734 TaxID=768710 RepID=H5Y183_9FIRM|nr:hypothetical protein [Desulfosporosinus youngiae]EHQ87421.1 hypothetical protein DesyoDRAFT_0224 [Desulfosporosinus youngiae DSM 17734]
MKEKYVWLSPKELQLMLKGSLQWIDILPRVTSSRAGMRKLNESLNKSPYEPTIPKPEQVQLDSSKEKRIHSKRIEGQPVIWLLGSVGFLTLSSWLYFVLFSK